VPANEPNPTAEAEMKTGAVEGISETMQPFPRPKHNAKT
jgi:hypothetical protein